MATEIVGKTPRRSEARTHMRLQATTLLAFAGFVLFAGANGTAVSFVVLELPPFWAAASLFVPASMVFALAAVMVRRRFPRGRALIGAVLFGFFGFFGTYVMIYWAFQFVKPGAAQVIVALTPLLTLLLAVAQGQERYRWRALVGALASLAGIALIVQDRVGAPARPLAILALVLAGVCSAEAAVVAKMFPKGDVLATNAVALAVGGILLTVVSWAAREPWRLPSSRATWIATAYLLVLGSGVAFALFLVVLQRWSASAAAYQWVLLPLVAIPLSAATTGERLTPWIYVGGLFVVGGVYVGALWKQTSGPPRTLDAATPERESGLGPEWPSEP